MDSGGRRFHRRFACHVPRRMSPLGHYVKLYIVTPMYRIELCTVRSRWVRFLGFLQGFREVGRRGPGHSFGDCVRPVAAPSTGPCPTVHSRRTDRLCKGLLTSYLDTYTRYLTERGYVQRTIGGYHACFAHFFTVGVPSVPSPCAVSTKLSSRSSLTSICLAVTARSLCDVIGWSCERH
jgi:hypothetical protein